MADSSQHSVNIDGTECEVRVVKTGKVTWMTYGNYKEHHISETGRSPSAALRNWKYAAGLQADWP